MAKTLNGGALISYGPSLPPATASLDGALFYKTDGVGGAQGLYMYGFIRDTSPGIIGNQVSQGWIQATSPDLFVLKTGDTMRGALTVPGFVRITQTSGAQRLVLGNQDAGGTNRPAIIEGYGGVTSIGTGDIWSGNGGTLSAAKALIIDGSAAAGLTFRSGQVWHQGNQGSGSGLDADLLDGQHGVFYQNASNINAGTLGTAFGGTGSSTAPVPGGLLYGTPSGTSSVSGTSGQVLLSNGAAAPSWVNQSALSVGNASTANTANSATTAGFATTAGTAAAVPWTGITGLPAASQNSVNSPAAGFTTYARPSLFYNMGVTGALSMIPSQFVPGSISGFDAYSTSDMGTYQAGITVVGLAGDGKRSMQLTANWNFNDGAPTGLRYRQHGDNSTVGQWSPFQTLWDQGNLTRVSQLANDAGYATTTASNAAYVLKSGDTMTGNLIINGNSVVYLPAGAVIVGNNASSSGRYAVIFNTGDANFNNINCTTISGTLIRMNGGGSNSGYIEFLGTSGYRQGYIGYASTNGTTDTGTLNYVAATHAFNGSIVASGNITAFSDARLKTDVKRILSPIQKVQQLNGVTFTNILTGQQGTGLIAQDVKAVMPEAVVENEDGMLSVAYGNMVGLLVEAMKTQQVQLDGMMAEIDRLNRKINAVRAK